MNNSPAGRGLPLGLFPGEPRPSLPDRVVELFHVRHYRPQTEQAYTHWDAALALTGYAHRGAFYAGQPTQGQGIVGNKMESHTFKRR